MVTRLLGHRNTSKPGQGTPQRTFVDVAGAERYLANAMELVDVDPRDAEGPPTMRGEPVGG